MPIDAQLVEGATDLLLELLADRMEMSLTQIDAEVRDGIDLGRVHTYYIAEQVEPLVVPAIFVLPDVTDFRLSAQTLTLAEHRYKVIVVLEDVGVERLTRKAWRYARAVWMALHDQSLGTIHCLVDRIVYGPTFTEARDGRAFRKDIAVDVRVLQAEDFR